MTIQHVSEFPATAPEQIDHFAKLLSKSDQRRKVFWEIYRGKSKRAKTAEEIGKRVGLTPKRVLEIATPLAANNLFEKTKDNGRTAYRKYQNINTVKQKIMGLASNTAKLEAHITTRKPKVSSSEIRVRVDRRAAEVFADVRFLTIDDVHNFSKVRSLKHKQLPSELDPPKLPEKVFKYGMANILGNKGTFKDWGGEKSDLYTSNLKIKGKRYASAIGFKGPATTGTLTPRKMGHNGDQIQRLFDGDAQVFIVQYEGPMAESIQQQLKGLAVNKSVQDHRTVFYGTIALEDSYRLRMRYAKEFKKAANKSPS
ncbi:MAG TPA: hypothetical protein VGR03_19225 [Candidatus Acidoferrum sp.]|nr:hypothetical protein [Candidatus Acidoferrum sp.]